MAGSLGFVITPPVAAHRGRALCDTGEKEKEALVSRAELHTCLLVEISGYPEPPLGRRRVRLFR